MLRPAVISRKIGGCNQTLAGALTHSILASLMATCHQQGQRFLDLARKLWHAGEPRPWHYARGRNADKEFLTLRTVSFFRSAGL